MIFILYHNKSNDSMEEDHVSYRAYICIIKVVILGCRYLTSHVCTESELMTCSALCLLINMVMYVWNQPL